MVDSSCPKMIRVGSATAAWTVRSTRSSGAFGFALQIAGVIREDRAEVGQRSFHERQQQTREPLVHCKVGRAVRTRLQVTVEFQRGKPSASVRMRQIA